MISTKYPTYLLDARSHRLWGFRGLREAGLSEVAMVEDC